MKETAKQLKIVWQKNAAGGKEKPFFLMKNGKTRNLFSSREAIHDFRSFSFSFTKEEVEKGKS
jgi:hypothetical protein